MIRPSHGGGRYSKEIIENRLYYEYKFMMTSPQRSSMAHALSG